MVFALKYEASELVSKLNFLIQRVHNIKARDQEVFLEALRLEQIHEYLRCGFVRSQENEIHHQLSPPPRACESKGTASKSEVRTAAQDA